MNPFDELAAEELAAAATVTRESSKAEVDDSDFFQPLKRGTVVRVFGLSARPELNDRIGRIMGWVKEKGRYQVKLETEAEPIGVKPEKVEVTVVKDLPDLGKRQCRCMFCGELILCESEGDAVKHLETCRSLGQQLASKEQFTVPTGSLPRGAEPTL